MELENPHGGADRGGVAQIHDEQRDPREGSFVKPDMKQKGAGRGTL